MTISARALADLQAVIVREKHARGVDWPHTLSVREVEGGKAIDISLVVPAAEWPWADDEAGKRD